MLNSLITSLITIFFIQLIFASFAMTAKSDKLTDLSYGLTFIITALSTTYINSSSHLPQYIILVAIILWGVRLSTYLLIRTLKNKKDKRFDKIRENKVRFARFWLFQTISIFIIMLPVVAALSSKTEVKNYYLFLLGIIIFLIGLIIESVADMQKYRFKSNPKNKDRWIESGLWKYSRHPNYFGEMLVWWGLYFASIPLIGKLSPVFAIGPMYISYLLIRVSGIPLLEENNKKKYKDNPKYLEYIKRTSILIPLPPKRK